MDEFLEHLQNLLESIYLRVPRPKPLNSKIQKIKVIAHRGQGSWISPQCRENTLEAFRQSLDCGVWGVECDLRWTKDNVPVISHDENTQRVWGIDLNISQTSLEELRRHLPQIPRLNEVLELFSGQCHLMLEIKRSLSNEQMQLLRSALADWVPAKDFHLMSLNTEILDELKEFPEKCFVSIAEVKRETVLSNTLQNHWGGYTGHYLLTTSAIVSQLKNKQIPIGTGFINGKNLLFREINRDIDWVFTDRADEIMKVIKTFTSSNR